MATIDDLLALIELTGRADPIALRLWACDCARRAVHSVLTGPRSLTHDPRFRVALAQVSEHLRGRTDLEVARRLVAALDGDYATPGPLHLASSLVSAAVGCAQGSIGPDEVASLALQALLHEHSSGETLREFETRWQARRLLWRTGLMPRLPDMLVRLDLAEAAGAVPSSGPALARFDALRAQIHASEDARLDLILEFGEALYLLEFGRQ